MCAGCGRGQVLVPLLLQALVLQACCCWSPTPPRPASAPQIVCTDQLPAGHERSLEGVTLKRLVHFLRFAYHPEEVRPWGRQGGVARCGGVSGRMPQHYCCRRVSALSQRCPSSRRRPSRQVETIDFLMPGAAKSLSAAARLAHQLDMPALLEALDARMEAAGAWGPGVA